MLRRRASKTLSYQREVDKGKLTAVASFEKPDSVYVGANCCLAVHYNYSKITSTGDDPTITRRIQITENWSSCHFRPCQS